MARLLVQLGFKITPLSGGVLTLQMENVPVTDQQRAFHLHAVEIGMATDQTEHTRMALAPEPLENFSFSY